MAKTEVAKQADRPKELEGFFPDAADTGLSADDMDGLTPDISRITIPAGGAVSFEVPGDDPASPDTVKELDAIVVHSHAASVLWLSTMDDRSGEDGGRPHAYSDDGKTQVITEEGEEFLKAHPNLPRPSVDLASCPYNQWGSATLVDPKANARGKATKNLRRLYLVREGVTVPEVLTLPPTSLKSWSNYVLKNTSRYGGPGKVLTRCTLERVVKGSIKWSVAQFQVVTPLTPDLVAASLEAKSIVEAGTKRAPMTGDDYTTKKASDSPSDVVAHTGEPGCECSECVPF